jgi:putative tryptophan/tyrosine transport system substrate-binding protein
MVLRLFAILALVSVHLAQAQQADVYRVGVIHQGGPFYVVVDGLKDGLKDLGFEEGKNYVLEIRDAKGDLKSVEDAARRLEREKVNLVYVVTGSATLAAKRATTKIPIVFAVAGDPVAAGLVESFSKPGGRLTGLQYPSAELTPKRLEILTEIIPKLRKVVTFYDPSNKAAEAAAKSAREAATRMKVDLIERHVASVQELRLAMKALKREEADAYIYTNDAMVAGQAQFIIDAARSKRLPTMFHEPSLASEGALVCYGVSYREIGRLSAKYVQRILAGAEPRTLPVEAFSKVTLSVNLQTARELGVAIPKSVLSRADSVIE